MLAWKTPVAPSPALALALVLARPAWRRPDILPRLYAQEGAVQAVPYPISLCIKD